MYRSMENPCQLLPIVLHSRARRDFSSSERLFWNSESEKGMELREGLAESVVRAFFATGALDREDLEGIMSSRVLCRFVEPVCVLRSPPTASVVAGWDALWCAFSLVGADEGRGIVFLAWGSWAGKRVAKLDKVRLLHIRRPP